MVGREADGPDGDGGGGRVEAPVWGETDGGEGAGAGGEVVVWR